VSMPDHHRPPGGVRAPSRRRLAGAPSVGGGPAEPAPDSAPVAETELGEADAKVAELTDDLRRVHAEYANYRKRVDRDRDTAREATIGQVLTELLPILDDVARAREHGELEGAFKSVGESLEGVCARLGLETFGAADEAFDPAIHEALTSETREGLNGPTVTAVYQPGYRLAGRVLRPARVAVADN
ncbi:MAG: nucleotide exchange factor GrpE, partial [Candidatus Nanopelagicales bacterium]